MGLLNLYYCRNRAASSSSKCSICILDQPSYTMRYLLTTTTTIASSTALHCHLSLFFLLTKTTIPYLSAIDLIHWGELAHSPGRENLVSRMELSQGQPALHYRQPQGPRQVDHCLPGHTCEVVVVVVVLVVLVGLIYCNVVEVVSKVNIVVSSSDNNRCSNSSSNMIRASTHQAGSSQHVEYIARLS